jgi:serine/threonine kinase 16
VPTLWLVLDVRLPTRHDNNTATLARLANFDMESSHPLHHAFETFKYHAKDLLSAISGCVCQQQSKLKINGRMCACSITYFLELKLRWISVRIEKVLGEGGFSFVYLAQDETSGVRAQSFCSCTVTTTDVGYVHQKEFALKKIRCPTGTEGVNAVMNEVAAYRRFKCVAQPLVHTR